MPTVAELAQQELSRRYSLQGRTQVAPRVQTIQNARPTVRSALSNLMRDAVDATGLEGGYRQGLLNAAGGVETAVDFLPVVGDALAVEDASRAYGQGDMVGAGINMMGVVPIVGDVAAKGVKSALRSLDMKPEARMQRAQDLGFDTSRPLYHYTNKLEDGKEFTSLQPTPENAQSKLGRGIYSSPKPEYADRYARQGQNLSEGYNENARAIPIYARGKLATGDEYEAAYKAATNSLGVKRGVVDQQTKLKLRSDIQNKAQEMLKDQGFKGVEFMDEIMVFDPKDVRSINAEFDPAKADSADLLSSVGATSALRGIV